MVDKKTLKKKVAPLKKKPQKGRGHITIGQIEIALRQTGGFVTYAAKKLDCTYANLKKRINGSPYLQEVKNSILESVLDLTEHSLIKQIKDDNLGAIIFMLKCKGKTRGYIERPKEDEIPEEAAQPVKVVIEVVDGRKPTV